MADSRRPIRRALISVYDKTGLEDLARALAATGVELVSTGSTAARIEAAGLPVGGASGTARDPFLSIQAEPRLRSGGRISICGTT